VITFSRSASGSPLVNDCETVETFERHYVLATDQEKSAAQLWLWSGRGHLACALWMAEDHARGLGGVYDSVLQPMLRAWREGIVAEVKRHAGAES
jgi:hypothetical protein